MAEATRIKGVDISVYQKGIPFDKLKEAGVQFAIIRAGFGKTKDSQLDKFVSECEKYGIKYGFYWFSYALTVDRAKEEAEACISAIKKYSPDYPVYYDMEDKSQVTQLNTRIRTDMCHAFCNKIRNAGYTAGVYANPSWFTYYLYKSELVGEYEIWLAHWTEDPNRPSVFNYGQRVWQWGLDHIANYNIDGNISFFDYSLSGKKEADAEKEPATAIPETIEIGSEVFFKGGCHFKASKSKTPVGGIRTAGRAKVINISPGAPHPYALVPVAGGSNVYGWVSSELVEAIKESPDTIQLNDKVTVKKGARDYRGGGLAACVYATTFTVMQIGCGVAPDYIVIGIGGDVTAAVKAKDLTKIGG